MKSAMKMLWLDHYRARFDALAPRERVAVSLLMLLSVWMFFYLLFVEPEMQQAEALSRKIDGTAVQARATEQQIDLFQKRLKRDPDAQNRQRLTRLKRQKQQINKQLQVKMQGLIAPAQMAQVLEAVLTQTRTLKLEKLKNLPVRPLLKDSLNKKKPLSADVGVYQHGLQIEFQGSYLEMLAYLKLLKTLPWNFYWDSIKVTMDRYPQAKILMTVHTLSLAPGWIGV